MTHPLHSWLLAAVATVAATSAAQAQKAPSTTLSAELRRLGEKAPVAVAHRGASRDFPENTLPAFRAAVAAGATVVELDFRQTSDGELVVMHDETLDRTTDCRARWKRQKVAVDSVTLAEVRELDAGRWKQPKFAGTRVPTLEEALGVIHDRSVAMIEHKAGEPERLVAVLERLDLVEDVLVQSFDWKWLEEVHRLAPRLTIGALGNKPVERSTLADLHKTGAAIAHWRGQTLRREDVRELRSRGYVVGAYTLNSDLEILGAAALGLHFITTDRPARLLALRSEGALERR